MDRPPPDQQPTRNKVTTYIARAVVFLVGIALLVLFLSAKPWQTADITTWLTFASITGLFIGYGLGGDIWGARLFDLFTGMKSRRQVERDAGRPVLIFSKMLLLHLLALLLFLPALLVKFIRLRSS